MRRLLALASLAALLTLAGPAAAQDEVQVDVGLPDAMAFGNATVLAGSLDVGQARLSDVGAANVNELSVPGSVLYVCPADEGEADQLPPVPTLSDHCQDEDRYEEPSLTVGGRTWLASRGNLSLTAPLDGTLSMVWRDNGTLRLASTLSNEGTRWTLEDGAGFAFTPTRASSEILVEGDERRWYNGTGWIFYVPEADGVTLAADGMHADVDADAGLDLTEAALDAFRAANDPRRLGDLQAAAVGPDAREPVANVTRLFDRFARIPHLANGALMGHLNGTLGERAVSPEDVTLVRVEEARLAAEEDRLVGNATVDYVRDAGGIAGGAGDPSGIPWWASALLWLAAGAALVLRDPPSLPAWTRWAGPPVGLAGLAAVDLALYGLVGVSAGSALLGDVTLGEGLALLGFEAIALAVAWGAFFLPARVAAGRLLPERAAPYARPILGAVGVVLVLVLPGVVVALGQLVARL